MMTIAGVSLVIRSRLRLPDKGKRSCRDKTDGDSRHQREYVKMR